MSPSDPLEPTDADDRLRSSSAGIRIVFGLYAGVLVAGFVTAAATLQAVSSASLAEIYLVGLAGGFLAGIAAAGIDGTLAIRLGRSRRRRASPSVPAVPFGAAAVASWWLSLESILTLVATGSAVGLLVLGYVVAELARTRYVEAVVAGDPLDSWRWTPPRAGKAYTLIALVWLFMALTGAASGNWTAAVVWVAIALGWIVAGVIEGRWQTGWGTQPEIRVYENGLVKRRPFTETLVPWEDVSHVRLRDDELVLDRDLFDVRLERSELADLETVRDAIERTRPNGAGRNRTAD
ncbi:PH domain-containing protein [Natronococcus wangiae]|uniref:PH domain-containing protein n=1 Tax=Natronococcus wangiae TaxID=3068275 RepID=UPI00273F77A8|nr:hypothetical protein [Natronococcus sp. AD5]